MFKNMRRVHSKKTPSGQDKIVNTLGKEILTRKHPSGSTLPAESVLMRRFKVSRTVLREVMKTLSAKGLVVLKPRIGARVLDSSNWNFFDAQLLAWRVEIGMDDDLRRWLREVRTVFEPAAAALAARGRTIQEVDYLRDRVRDMARCEGDREKFAEADLEFHLMIGVASRNPLMGSLAAVIEAALFAAFQENPPAKGFDWEETARSHGAIVDGIEAGDPEAAHAAMLRVIELGRARAAGKRAAPPKKRAGRPRKSNSALA
jgi:DNA-binding FadR family transcriptional regulator